MKTKEHVEKEFRAELQALLDKYSAVIEAEDHFSGYSECGQDIRITVSIPAIYDENHNCISEYTIVDLGGRIDVENEK